MVVGLATLEPVSFSLGKNVMCSSCSVSMRFAQWCSGRHRCLLSRYIVCLPPPGQGGRIIVVFYRSDGGVLSYRDARVTNGISRSVQTAIVFSSVCYRLDDIVL